MRQSHQKSEIELYNPKALPFGELSNNFPSSITIEDHKYPTVTNFIYSGLLTNPIYRMSLHTAPIFPQKKNTNIQDKIKQFAINLESKYLKVDLAQITKFVPLDVEFAKMNIYQLYNYYRNAEYVNTVRTALEKGYNAKVTGDVSLADLLQSTEERPIIYTSENTLMGVNKGGNGFNLVGKTLEQIRHNIQREVYLSFSKEKQKIYEEALFTAYKAYLILQYEVSQGNNLLDYLSLSAPEIVEKGLEKYSADKVGIKEGLKMEVIKHKINFPFLDKELKNPGFLVLYVRKNNLRRMEDENLSRKNQSIVEAYTKYTLLKRMPNLSEEDAKKAASQLLDSYVQTKRQSPGDFQSYQEMEKKIVNMYYRKEFSEELNLEIKKALKKIPSISEPEIEENISERSDAKQEERTERTGDGSTDGSESDNSIQAFLAAEKPKGSKVTKKYLINKLQSLTGKPASKFSGKSVKELKAKLEKIETVGKWIVQIQNRRPGYVKKELIAEFTSKPSERQLDKLSIKQGVPKDKFIISRTSGDKPSENQEIVEPGDEEDEEKLVGKTSGAPFYIDNREDTKLSPIYNQNFTVDDQTYPSISLYITTMLLTKSGINSSDTLGRQVPAAREMVMVNGNFLDSNQANDVYNTDLYVSVRSLAEKLAWKALLKKFEDYHLQSILLLTGKKTIVWADPNDNLLGKTRSGGENKVGLMLMEIRKTLEEKARIEIPKNINTSDIYNFVQNDKFMANWFNMRILDMCGTVFKVKSYLSYHEIEQDINEDLVSHVLRRIYSPCKAVIDLEKDIHGEPPFKFVKMVERCQGSVITRDYDKEIEQIFNEVKRLEIDFFGWSSGRALSPPIKNVSYEEFMEKINEENAKFLEGVYSPRQKKKFTEQQQAKIVNFMERKEQPQRLSETREKTFEDIQREEWKTFMDTITTVTDSEVKTAKVKGVKGTKGKKKAVGGVSIGEKASKIKEFVEKQTRDAQEYYGTKIIPRTKDETAQFNDALKEKQKKQAQIQKELNLEIALKLKNTQEIAKTYWNHLMVLVYFILEKMDSVSEIDVKKILINSEEILAEQSCASRGFKNADMDCIAGALTNLLSEIFYINSVVDLEKKKCLEELDIDLAKSIILNTEFKPKKKVEIVVEKEEEAEEDNLVGDNLVGEAEEDEENNIADDALIEDNLEDNPVEDNFPDDISEEETEFRDDMALEDQLEHDDISEESDVDFGFSFGFSENKFNPKIETVKKLLKEICPEKRVSTSICEYFIKTMNDILNSKTQKLVKKNRIAFFASVRN